MGKIRKSTLCFIGESLYSAHDTVHCELTNLQHFGIISYLLRQVRNNRLIKRRIARCRHPILLGTDLSQLVDKDLQFLIENFPKPGRSYEEIAQLIHHLPTTLESMLNSESLFDKIRDRSLLILEISPFLFFSVLLRRSLMDQRILGDKKVINYIANLLGLFVRTDRLHRIHRNDKQTHHYLTDMIQEAAKCR